MRSAPSSSQSMLGNLRTLSNVNSKMYTAVDISRCVYHYTKYIRHESFSRHGVQKCAKCSLKTAQKSPLKGSVYSSLLIEIVGWKSLTVLVKVTQTWILEWNYVSCCKVSYTNLNSWVKPCNEKHLYVRSIL